MKRGGNALVLALCMLLTLSACGKNKTEKAEEASATPARIPNEAF